MLFSQFLDSDLPGSFDLLEDVIRVGRVEAETSASTTWETTKTTTWTTTTSSSFQALLAQLIIHFALILPVSYFLT